MICLRSIAHECRMVYDFDLEPPPHFCVGQHCGKYTPCGPGTVTQPTLFDMAGQLKFVGWN